MTTDCVLLSFKAQIGERILNLFFHLSMFLLAHLVSSTDPPFHVLTNMSSGSEVPDYGAAKAPKDCNEKASGR